MKHASWLGLHAKTEIIVFVLLKQVISSTYTILDKCRAKRIPCKNNDTKFCDCLLYSSWMLYIIMINIRSIKWDCGAINYCLKNYHSQQCNDVSLQCRLLEQHNSTYQVRSVCILACLWSVVLITSSLKIQTCLLFLLFWGSIIHSFFLRHSVQFPSFYN